MPIPSASSIVGVILQMRQAITFKSIKLTLCLPLEAQIFFTCISQQGQSINGEFLPLLYWQVRFFTHDITIFGNWMRVFGKTLRYGLEHAAVVLHSERSPILMNTDRVLYRNAR